MESEIGTGNIELNFFDGWMKAEAEVRIRVEW